MGVSVTASPPLVAADPTPTARGFLQTLEQTLNRLATLKIVTVVGEIAVDGTGLGTMVTVRPNAPAEAASSEIDLLNGQIINTFSSGFSALGGGTLQTFHQAQVEKSSGIMMANLLELQKLASALLSSRR